jgi:hypothetical protein
MNFSKLCKPAQIYLFVEVLIILVIVYQNWRYDDNTLCIGDYACSVSSKTVLVITKLIYVGFWTFILNLMCKGGYKNFAWFLVLLPLILFFVALTLLMFTSNPVYIGGMEGFDGAPVDRLSRRNTSPGDAATEQAIQQYGVGTMRQDYSFPDLSPEEQREYETPEGFEGFENNSRKVNKAAERVKEGLDVRHQLFSNRKREGMANKRRKEGMANKRRKEGFGGNRYSRESNDGFRDRRRDGSCNVGGVTGADLSSYPSQFNNDYYNQI